MARDENQPVRVVEVERELPLAVSLQLMQASWDIAQILEAHRRVKRIEPGADQLSAASSLRPHQLGLLVALLTEFSLFKQDIHESIPRQ
jgi:hypothetical protein